MEPEFKRERVNWSSVNRFFKRRDNEREGGGEEHLSCWPGSREGGLQSTHDKKGYILRDTILSMRDTLDSPTLLNGTEPQMSHFLLG
eukprot:scaffold229964_cov63-Attheya_sp.AAC.1